MSKVLISFVGTGGLSGQETPKSLREYRTAKYKIGDKIYEKAFMADALADHFDIDRIILIGTVKSMWEAVYASFYQKRTGQSIGDNEAVFAYYADIATFCEQSNHESDFSLPHQEEIENVLGDQSKIILIKYGVNEEELNENISQILNIEQFLRTYDEIIVDITHAFRSLPMLLMNTMIYLQDVSKKHVSISHIYYGMLECSTELGFTPVVDLKKVMEVNEWISGAYSFMEFGNAYKISKLLEAYGDRSNATVLRTFSDVKNLNHITALEKQIPRLNSIRNLPPAADLTVTPVIRDFIKAIRTNNNAQKHSRFQYNLAKWHASKHNYSAAYLSLTEAIITYVCEMEGWDYNDKECRENAKGRIYQNEEYVKLKSIFNAINRQRKAIAHALEFRYSVDSIIQTLQNGLNQAKDILFAPEREL